MKICLAQYDIKWEDKEANYKKAEAFMAEAAEKKADIVLFPELGMTGFSMDVAKIGEDEDNPDTVAVFRGLALKYGIAAGVGFAGIGRGKAANRYAIISAKGEVLADYKKIHPFSYGMESEYYEGGNLITGCSMDGVYMVPFICYDLRFPEIFQAASKKASLIIVAANWPKARKEHWVTLLKARAIENQCYIAGINRIGTGDGIAYSGDSMIVDPYGAITASAGEEECLIDCVINPEIVVEYRKTFRVKDDRREDIYRALYAISGNGI